MEADYKTFTISNSNAELSGHYPSQIVILEYEHTHYPYLSTTPTNVQQSSQRTTNTIYECIYDANKVRDLFYKARCAR